MRRETESSLLINPEKERKEREENEWKKEARTISCSVLFKCQNLRRNENQFHPWMEQIVPFTLSFLSFFLSPFILTFWFEEELSSYETHSNIPVLLSFSLSLSHVSYQYLTGTKFLSGSRLLSRFSTLSLADITLSLSFHPLLTQILSEGRKNRTVYQWWYLLPWSGHEIFIFWTLVHSVLPFFLSFVSLSPFPFT